MAKPASIKKVERLPASGGACVGLFAHPGYGKTTLVGTGGKGTLIIHPPTDHMTPIEDPNVEGWEVSDWNDMNEVEEFLRHEGDQYDWVWVDSWSLLQDHLLDDVWQWTVDKFPHRAKTPIDKGEYNLNFVREQRWMRNVVGIAKSGMFNFGFTAHTMDLEDAVTGESKIQPWVQGKNMSDKFQGYMHVVAYLDLTKKGSRIIRVDATKDYVAKNQLSRYGSFPEGKMVNPTMVKINTEINKARKGTTRRKRQRRK